MVVGFLGFFTTGMTSELKNWWSKPLLARLPAGIRAGYPLAIVRKATVTERFAQGRGADLQIRVNTVTYKLATDLLIGAKTNVNPQIVTAEIEKI